MRNEARIGRMIVAGQPSDEEIASLAGRGIDTLVNLRLESELAEPEGPKAQSVGLTYVEAPFNGDTVTFAHVHRVREAVERSSSDVVVHCHGGTRAAVMAAIVETERAGEDAAAALARAAEAGFDLEGTRYADFIVRYFEAIEARR